MSGAAKLPVQIGGLPYVLTFKFGTMRLAEQELGRPFMRELSGGSAGLDTISALFWAVMQPAHRMTREASDDLVDEAGMGQVGKWIGEGISRYLGKGGEAPAASGKDAEAGEAKPGKRPAS